MSKYLINYILIKYDKYQITLECINSLTRFYEKYGFKLYKCNFVSYYNKYNWNVMYINKKPNYDIIFNECYNYKVRYNEYIYNYLLRIRYFLLKIKYFHLYHLHYHLSFQNYIHYIHQFVDFQLNIVPKSH